MARVPNKPVEVDEISESRARFDAYRRTNLYEEAKAWARVILIRVFVWGVIALVSLCFLVGFFGIGAHIPYTNILAIPDTEGTRALATLFAEVVGNVKTIGLIAFGFFFREYLNGKNNS